MTAVSSQSRVPPPREPICDKNGIVTTSWWRWFNSQYVVTGSGQSTQTLAEVSTSTTTNTVTIVENTDLAHALAAPSGPDYGSRLTTDETALASLPNPSGRIAALEARLAQLEAVLAAIQTPKVDLNQIRRDLDKVTAYALGYH